MGDNTFRMSPQSSSLQVWKKDVKLWQPAITMSLRYPTPYIIWAPSESSSYISLIVPQWHHVASYILVKTDSTYCQCWFIINEILWHSFQVDVYLHIQDFNHKVMSEIYLFLNHLLGDNEWNIYQHNFCFISPELGTLKRNQSNTKLFHPPQISIIWNSQFDACFTIKHTVKPLI